MWKQQYLAMSLKLAVELCNIAFTVNLILTKNISIWWKNDKYNKLNLYISHILKIENSNDCIILKILFETILFQIIWRISRSRLNCVVSMKC